MTVKERLILFLKHQNLSQKVFAEQVGISSGYVNAIKVSIQPKTLHKISMQFPSLNTGWLLTGEGKMIKGPVEYDSEISSNNENAAESKGSYYSKKNEISMPREVFDMINKLTDTIQSQQRTIELLERQNKKSNVQEGDIAGFADAG